ncbi:MAG TPA: 3'-5' exonuclease [Solirubrobacteraceae bacterium]|jgi:DNA polymerase-3 subunit epsilon
MRLLARRSGAAARFAHTAVPDPRTPWREAEWCAIDLELTGLHRADEIIAIGAVPIRGGALILGEAMYTLARPGRPPRHDSVLVHKIRTADLEQAPTLSEAIDRLLDVFAGRVPVFHTAVVERTFLGRELRGRRLRLPDDADTEVLGRLWLRTRDGVTPPGLPLARLAAVLGQPAEDPHHALGDALTTGKAFIALASHLERAGYRTVGSLTHADLGSGRPTGRFAPDQ